jgi:hypothetical protein
MAVWDLVTGVTTRALPAAKQPDGYREELFQRGTAHRMASGALVREATSTTTFRRIEIEWQNISPTQALVVLNALADMDDGSTALFSAPSGADYTVVLAEDGYPTWTVTAAAGGTIRYSGVLKLEQNS